MKSPIFATKLLLSFKIAAPGLKIDFSPPRPSLSPLVSVGLRWSPLVTVGHCNSRRPGLVFWPIFGFRGPVGLCFGSVGHRWSPLVTVGHRWRPWGASERDTPTPGHHLMQVGTQNAQKLTKPFEKRFLTKRKRKTINKKREEILLFFKTPAMSEPTAELPIP